MNNNKFLSFLLAVPFFAAADESKKDDKQDNKSHSKFNFSAGAGVFAGMPITESYSAGAAILGRYNNSYEASGLLGLYGNMAVSNDYVQGIRVVAGAILAMPGKFESAAHTVNEKSVGELKVTQNPFKGFFGMVLADFGYVMGGIYSEFSSKGILLNKSLSFGVVIMGKYQANDYLEGVVMGAIGYNCASKETEAYSKHKAEVSKIIADANKANVEALAKEKEKAEGEQNKAEIKELTESKEKTTCDVYKAIYKDAKTLEVVIANAKHVGTTEAETKEFEAILKSFGSEKK